MARKSTAFVDIDLDAAGKHVGCINIPHSPHEDAWGVTQIPVAVIANGSGPTVIIEGGNHGDEYEGPIVIGELIRTLDPGEVAGRLILLPAVNVHASVAGRRTSPVDGLNYNRTFPGDPTGSITQQISAFVNDHIFPRAQAFLSLHSGGSSLDILPSAAVEPCDDPTLHARNVAAVRAFGAPVTLVIANLGDQRTATAAACRHGLVTVGTEMGGGGTVSLEALAVCRRGVRKTLAHLGIVAAPAAAQPNPASRLLTLAGPAAYTWAPADGIFEPLHPLGTAVQQGQPAGLIHRPWEPRREPDTLRFAVDGIVYGRRQPGRVTRGNCCLVVASPYEGDLE